MWLCLYAVAVVVLRARDLFRGQCSARQCPGEAPRSGWRKAPLSSIAQPEPLAQAVVGVAVRFRRSCERSPFRLAAAFREGASAIGPPLAPLRARFALAMPSLVGLGARVVCRSLLGVGELGRRLSGAGGGGSLRARLRASERTPRRQEVQRRVGDDRERVEDPRQEGLAQAVRDRRGGASRCRGDSTPCFLESRSACAMSLWWNGPPGPGANAWEPSGPKSGGRVFRVVAPKLALPFDGVLYDLSWARSGLAAIVRHVPRPRTFRRRRGRGAISAPSVALDLPASFRLVCHAQFFLRILLERWLECLNARISTHHSVHSIMH